MHVYKNCPVNVFLYFWHLGYCTSDSFVGIASKVDYIGETLDVNVIWINSIYKSDGDYDGNAVVNHKDVDETLGTLADFDSLRKTTKKKGILCDK